MEKLLLQNLMRGLGNAISSYYLGVPLPLLLLTTDEDQQDDYTYDSTSNDAQSHHYLRPQRQLNATDGNGLDGSNSNSNMHHEDGSSSGSGSGSSGTTGDASGSSGSHGSGAGAGGFYSLGGPPSSSSSGSNSGSGSTATTTTNHNATSVAHRDAYEFVAFLLWYIFLVLCCVVPTCCAYRRRRLVEQRLAQQHAHMARSFQQQSNFFLLSNLAARRNVEAIQAERARILQQVLSSTTMTVKESDLAEVPTGGSCSSSKLDPQKASEPQPSSNSNKRPSLLLASLAGGGGSSKGRGNAIKSSEPASENETASPHQEDEENVVETVTGVNEAVTTTGPAPPAPSSYYDIEEAEPGVLQLPVDGMNGNRSVSGTCAICLCPYEAGDQVTWSPSSNTTNTTTTSTVPPLSSPFSLALGGGEQQPSPVVGGGTSSSTSRSNNTRCLHCFHTDCIVQWLAKNAEPKCPVCRQDYCTVNYSPELSGGEFGDVGRGAGGPAGTGPFMGGGGGFADADTFFGDLQSPFGFSQFFSEAVARARLEATLMSRMEAEAAAAAARTGSNHPNDGSTANAGAASAAAASAMPALVRDRQDHLRYELEMLQRQAQLHLDRHAAARGHYGLPTFRTAIATLEPVVAPVAVTTVTVTDNNDEVESSSMSTVQDDDDDDHDGNNDNGNERLHSSTAAAETSAPAAPAQASLNITPSEARRLSLSHAQDDDDDDNQARRDGSSPAAASVTSLNNEAPDSLNGTTPSEAASSNSTVSGE